MSSDRNKKFNLKKKLVLEVTGKELKKLRKKGILALSYEYDLPSKSLQKTEKGLSDPLFTTMWRMVEANGIPFWQFIKIVQENLPENFSFFDD